MTQVFNPYHKWLGIETTQQPIDHYRLLGLNVFEGDADVIENAADRQMNHVRRFQHGPHVQWSQRLLNEIAVARNCLLNPVDKRLYDRWLHERTEAVRSATAYGMQQGPVARIAVPQPPPVAVARYAPLVHKRPPSRTGRSPGRRWEFSTGLLLVAIAVLAVSVGTWIFSALTTATVIVDWPESQRYEGVLYLDGRPVPIRARGPLLVHCRPGLHELKVRPAGCRDFVQQMQLSAGEYRTVAVTSRPVRH